LPGVSLHASFGPRASVMSVLMRFYGWWLKHSSHLIKVRQRCMSEALQLKVSYLGILGGKSVHFVESKHGSAAIFSSGVSKLLVPLWSFMDRNTQSLFVSAVLLNSNTIFWFLPRW
jgi:hypothetical protein